MEMNGGFLVTKIKQLGDRIFEKILSEKNIDAFNGAQGRILYVLWQEDGISIRSLSTKCGLAITSLTTMLERMENQGLRSHGDRYGGFQSVPTGSVPVPRAVDNNAPI